MELIWKEILLMHLPKNAFGLFYGYNLCKSIFMYICVYVYLNEHKITRVIYIIQPIGTSHNSYLRTKGDSASR